MPADIAHAPPLAQLQSCDAADGAHTFCSSTAVLQTHDLLAHSKVPDRGVTGRRRCGKDSREVGVPLERGDVVESGGQGARRDGVGVRVVQVEDEELRVRPSMKSTHLCVDRARHHEILLDRVEVESSDGSGELVALEDASIIGADVVSWVGQRITTDLAPSRILTGSNTLISPVSMPAARTPRT